MLRLLSGGAEKDNHVNDVRKIRPVKTMGVNVGQLAIRIAGMAAVFTVTLFLPAGTLAWPAAWVFLVLFFGFTMALSLWLLRFNPDLLAERMTGIGKPDQKTWDKVLLAITAVAFFAWLALMGLDAVRFHWSQVPLWLRVLGALLVLCSFYLFFVTFRENPYLSPAVRIQTDRAQTVVSTGPYRYVRHPMYAGFVLFALSTALMLGSWYGVLGALLLVGIVARRAVLEERVLREELEGYGIYMTRVRYRLVPYVW
jgi:protein-S-isoprenylcysteine O-methyltransferase Ste14